MRVTHSSSAASSWTSEISPIPKMPSTPTCSGIAANGIATGCLGESTNG